MDPTTLTTVLTILAILLILWLLWQLLKLLLSRPRTSSDEIQEALRQIESQLEKADGPKKEASLRELIKASKDASKPETQDMAKVSLKRLLAMAGVSHKELEDVSHESELVRKLAEQLDTEEILNHSEALSIQLPKVKAKKTTSKTLSLFPTLQHDMEVAQGPEDLLRATPEELYRREETYEKLERGDLHVVTYYKEQVTDAILHLVIDVSQSMAEQMSNGHPKRIHARAVARRLLTRARRGDAKFLLRFFDGDVHPLKTANNAKEADALIRLVDNQGFSGGGTEILGAIKKAVRDIEEAMKNNPNFEAEIVLITDGEPNTPFSADELREILGEFKIHVNLIGSKRNDALEEVATTFQRIN